MATERLGVIHLLDVNVLVALAWPQHVHHRRARLWFGALSEPWATTPLTEAAFVRLTLTPAVVGRAVSVADALAAVEQMRAHPKHRFLADDSSLVEPRISLERLATARQITDAHLVNLAAAADGVLVTLDRGIAELVAPPDRARVLLVPS